MSPHALLRTTSQKNPPRPSIISQPPPFTRTLSTSSFGGVNGKRPIPAPRPSLGSRSDADYHSMDKSLPDTSPIGQLNAVLSPGIENSSLHRASTLPTSVTRPPPPSHPSHLNIHQQKVSNTAQLEMDSGSSSTLEQHSSESSSQPGSHSAVSRLNSRSSLTGSEKKERRKSELLETSPYPRLSGLVSSAASRTECISQSHITVSDQLAPLTSQQDDNPVYSTINKDGASPVNAQCVAANAFEGAEAFNVFGVGRVASSVTAPHSPTSPIYERISAIYSSQQTNSSDSQSNYSEPIHPGTCFGT